jgi:hypothetical protein
MTRAGGAIALFGFILIGFSFVARWSFRGFGGALGPRNWTAMRWIGSALFAVGVVLVCIGTLVD